MSEAQSETDLFIGGFVVPMETPRLTFYETNNLQMFLRSERFLRYIGPFELSPFVKLAERRKPGGILPPGDSRPGGVIPSRLARRV